MLKTIVISIIGNIINLVSLIGGFLFIILVFVFCSLTSFGVLFATVFAI